MQKDHSNRPSRKRELPAHMIAIARRVAAATGRPFGEVSDAMLAEAAERAAGQKARAYAAKNTATLPEPVEALPPRTHAGGPKDQARIAERGRAAQHAYLATGESRALCELVIKSPEWYRWGARAWRDPQWAIGKLPPAVRRPLRQCATRSGKAWGQYGRGLVATTYLIHRLAQRTKRSGVQVLAGVSGGLLGSCIPSASGKHHTLSAQTLTARRHRGAAGVPGTEGIHGGLAGDAMRHECGYIEALRQIGVLFAFQPRSDAVPKWQLGRRGYACLQFLLPDSLWCAPEPEPDPPPA